MPGKFTTHKDEAGEFRFRLKASNGQTVLAKQGYECPSVRRQLLWGTP